MTHSQKLWWWGTAGGAVFDANVVMPGTPAEWERCDSRHDTEMAPAGPLGPAGHGFGRAGRAQNEICSPAEKPCRWKSVSLMTFRGTKLVGAFPVNAGDTGTRVGLKAGDRVLVGRRTVLV